METFRSHNTSVNGRKSWSNIPAGMKTRFLIFGVLLCGFLGASLFFIPELTIYLLVFIGLGIPAFLLIWSRPEFGLIGSFFLTSSFISSEDLLDIRLPIGGLDFRDLFFFFLVGVLVLRVLIQRRELRLWRNVGLSLIMFLFLVLFSAFNALFLQGVEANWAFSDLRALLYYLLYFITLWNIEDEKQLKTLFVGMFIIVDLSVLVIIMQQIVGVDNPVLAAMTSAQDWRIYAQEGGAVRIIPASHVMMHFLWIISFSLLVFIRKKPGLQAFLTFQLIFIGLGHILTYTRSQWVAAILGLGLMFIIVLPQLKDVLPKVITIGMAFTLILLMVFGLAGTAIAQEVPFVAGIVERFTSLVDPVEVLDSKSLEWRAFENSEAIKAIKEQPLVGVGLGGRYRELTTLAGEAMGWMTRNDVSAGVVSRFTRYVHNSYLHIAVKIGVPALLVLLYFSFIFMGNSWKLYQSMPDSYLRGIVLGVLLSFLGFLAWAYFHTHLLKMESIPVIAVMTGIVGVISYQYKQWTELEEKKLVDDI